MRQGWFWHFSCLPVQTALKHRVAVGKIASNFISELIAIKAAPALCLTQSIPQLHRQLFQLRMRQGWFWHFSCLPDQTSLKHRVAVGKIASNFISELIAIKSAPALCLTQSPVTLTALPTQNATRVVLAFFKTFRPNIPQTSGCSRKNCL